MATIQDVRAVGNPQKSYMWEVEIKAHPTGPLETLSVYAKTVAIPQTAVEQVIINHKASKAHLAGRDASAHTVAITFWDDEDQTINKYMRDWFDIVCNPDTGNGVPKGLHVADLVIRLKDATDQTITSEVKLGHAWPMDIAEVPLSYDSSEPVEFNVTFSYDEFVRVS